VVALIPFIVFFLGIMPNWNWWGFPRNYVILDLIDLIVAWTLAGFVISKLVSKVYDVPG